MVMAIAGRRIDAANAKETRFPLANVELVRTRVRSLFQTESATAVVCAAACGADLIALSEAMSLGLRQRVVLPFERRRFRETSVTDRPGDWGALYDRILDDAEASGNLVVIPATPDDQAYAKTNDAILDETISLAAQLGTTAVAALVWDGISRGPGDITESFGTEARKRGLPLIEIRTV